MECPSPGLGIRLCGLRRSRKWHSYSGMKRARSGKLPAVLVYATGLTCGVLSAVALQIYLAGTGFSLVPLWDSLLSARVLDLRTTGPWWAIAGISFLISGVVAAALSRISFPLRRFRFARWILGIALVLLLAHLGQESAAIHPVYTAANTAISLVALGIASMLALCGAYFTVQR